MIANYHTHTARCGHAIGRDRAYVEQAIVRGLKELGFSDHVSMPFEGGRESSFRIPLAQLEDYVTTVLALRREYQQDIRICLGFEAEYYPDYWDRMWEMLAPYPVDYLILGQHFNDSRELSYNARPQKAETVLKAYVDGVLGGLATGAFLYLAHPDLIHFTGDGALYRREMERLCRGAKELDVPLEFNLLGLREGRNYPDKRFWELARQVGNRCIIGCDAHDPRDVADPDQLERALSMVRALGLEPESSLPIKGIAPRG